MVSGYGKWHRAQDEKAADIVQAFEIECGVVMEVDFILPIRRKQFGGFQPDHPLHPGNLLHSDYEKQHGHARSEYFRRPMAASFRAQSEKGTSEQNATSQKARKHCEGPCPAACKRGWGPAQQSSARASYSEKQWNS